MEPKPIKLPSKSYNLPYLLILTWNKPLTLNESIEKFRKYIKKEKLDYKEISKSFSYLNKYELIVQKDDFDRRNKKNSANRVFILNEISNILRLENDEKNKLNEILVNYELTETEYKRLSKLYIEKQKNYDFVYELTILMVVYLLIIIKFNIDLVHSEDYDYSLKKKLILKKYKMPLIDFSLITELKHSIEMFLAIKPVLGHQITVYTYNNVDHLVTDILRKVSILIFYYKSLDERYDYFSMNLLPED